MLFVEINSPGGSTGDPNPIGIIRVGLSKNEDLEAQLEELYSITGPGLIQVVPRGPNFGWVIIDERCRMPKPGSTYLCCTVNRKVMVTARPLDDWLIDKYSLTHWAEIVLPDAPDIVK